MSMLRVSETAHKTIKEIAMNRGISLQAAIEAMIEEYRRRDFLIQANSDYDRLKSDTMGWHEEAEERKLWEATLVDGLDSE